MRTLPYIVIVLLFWGLMGCSKDEPVLNDDITGDWKVASFVDNRTSTVITKSNDNTWNQFNNGDITVCFVKNDWTGGVITGIKVTNSFSGNYKIASNGVIKISNFLQTEINEPVWGRLFDSIVKAETFEVRDDQLRIFYSQRKKSINLERIIK